MFRKIIVPKNRQLLLQLPAEFVGKQVEVIAFEIHPQQENAIDTKKKRMKALEKALENYQVDMKNFKFNRNKANDYDN